MTLRTARSGEAQLIMNLIHCAFQGRRPQSRPDFSSQSAVEDLIAKGIFLLAEHEGKLLGCAYLEPNMGATRLELLAVCPSKQRSGIGSQLLEVAEDLSRRRECLFMHVRIINVNYPMLKFYRRRGYFQFGIEPMSAESSALAHSHLVVMCKQLDKYSHGF